MLYSLSNKTLLVSTTELTFILIITAVIFLLFIIVAVIKMYKLKAENKRLLEMDSSKTDANNSYQDFTEGHLYDNK
ncbi:hypothetical protein A9Q87_12380 [Flavobacteriales bacterium 34_180_T64]|nr:hypothetical protein A9Q87_12380 [Flavobacteriales bacterium 34_180_T64]